MKKKRRFFRRALAIAVLTTLASANAFGLSTDKYYKASATPTGAGKVYAAADNVQPATSSYVTGTSTVTVINKNKAYLYALPDDGYALQKWQRGTTDLEPANPYVVNFAESEGASSASDAQTIAYTAVFAKTAVTVKSEDLNKGTVSIDSPINTDGQTVTLTAYANNNEYLGSTFTEWYKNGVFVSKANPLTVTAVDGDVYVAKFNRTAGYFRLKSQYTGKYARLYGTGYQEATKSKDGFNGAIFTNGVQLVAWNDDYASDPSFIFRMDGIPEGTDTLLSTDIHCQGLSLRDSIIAKDYHDVNITTVHRQDENCYVLYYDYNGNRFLKDGANYGYNWALACGGESDHKWTLEPVNENSDSNYFGVNAPIEIDGSYYTTLYTSFPYQCGDDVEAYYVIPDEDEGGWTLEDIPDYTVPSNTPVILCCADSLSTNNRLIPLFDEPSPIDGIENNLLEGFISINGSESGSQYVLSTDGENLTFVQAPSVPSNQAYFIGNVAGARVSINKSTGIREVLTPSNKKYVYDISGRRISNKNENLSPGIYVINGKKRIVK